MKRSVDDATYEAMQGTFYPVAMTYIAWPDDPAYMHSGVGVLTYDGQEWQGAGNVAQLSVPAEAGGLVSSEAEITIAGTIDDILDALGPDVRGVDAAIYMGCTTKPGGNVLIGDPIQLFAGYVDGRNATHGENDTLSLTIGQGPSARSKAALTHTDETQRAVYPDDTLFRHVVHSVKRSVNPQTWPE